MRPDYWNRFLAVALLLMTAPALSAEPTRAELSRCRAWAKQHFGDRKTIPTAEPPFSFVYGGRPASEFLDSWTKAKASRKLDAKRTGKTITYADPKSGLVVTCSSVEYSDSPTVEWTLTLKNTGTRDTPIIENIRPLAVRLARRTGEFQLHWNTADNCTQDSYAPHVENLGPNTVFDAASEGGRPTTGGFPYWNVAFDNGGCITVLGWPGQWSAKFSRDAQNGLTLVAGQELTHFVLRPGEEVRSPIAVMLFYEGDWIRGQNLWRRWMVAHNLPRPAGELVPTHYAGCYANLQPVREEEVVSIEGFTQRGVQLDYWILDAGWYLDNGAWWNTGTWEVDRARFPKGVREVSDAAHRNGMGFVLWFEPERAVPGSWIVENHPEWILGGKKGGSVYLGNPDAWKWIVEKIHSLIVSEGVDVYRQDHNIAPLAGWRANDAEDRQGITEIKDVQGYLTFWDELLRRHPKLWIDSCASGGRRNDLQTLRRAVPLLRSDAFDGPITQQCQTYGISLWVPYYGSGTGIADEYMFRSCIFPASRIGGDGRDPKLDYDFIRRMIAEFRKVQPYLLDDYYPLTPYSLEKTAWIGWQLNSPEKGGGYVQAFRREAAPVESMTFKLRGLEARLTYLVEDLSTGQTRQITGREIMSQGLAVSLPQRSSALLVYRKAKRAK